MKSLVDQWLDAAACELEPVVTAILYHQQGKEADFGKIMEDVNKFLMIVEKHLKEKKFLVGESWTIADYSIASSVSVIFSVMLGEGPRKKYPNILNWYTAIATATTEVGPKDLPKEADDAFKGGKKGKKEEKDEKKEKKGGKKEDKKKEKKEETKNDPKKEDKKEDKKAHDSDDLFGDDDDPAPAPPV